MRAFRADDPVRVLERLLVLCADGAAGYRQAAAAVTEPRLHRRLARSAALREESGSVLTCALVALGRKPEHHGSLAGTMHRRWLDAVALVSPNGPLAILRECERGERETLEAFSTALGRSLPADVHSMVQSQLGRVLEASAALRGEIQALEDIVIPR
ncbi:MAG: hypothetical protein K0S65_2288 [Labilithrix sp.]|nr:hypothetical protein [Labilithrix sp.]